MYAGSYKFSFDMAAHGLGDILNACCEFMIAFAPQLAGICGQSCKWRLQPMREVTCASARPRDFCCLNIKQTVDFGDERLDLTWYKTLDVGLCPLTHCAYRLAKAPQWPKAQTNLNPCRHRKNPAEYQKRGNEIGDECTSCRGDASHVCGNRYPHRDGLGFAREQHRSLDGEHFTMSGAANSMLVLLSNRNSIFGQGK